MHELSIAMSVFEIVQEYAEREQARNVVEVELAIGALSGIEIPALRFALETSCPGFISKSSKIVINQIPAVSKCLDCLCVFTMSSLYDACPNCASYYTQVQSGQELSVKSIVIE